MYLGSNVFQNCIHSFIYVDQVLEGQDNPYTELNNAIRFQFVFIHFHFQLKQKYSK